MLSGFKSYLAEYKSARSWGLRLSSRRRPPLCWLDDLWRLYAWRRQAEFELNYLRMVVGKLDARPTQWQRLKDDARL
jgi:hypothetical protein